MQFDIGDIIFSKKNPERIYRVSNKWKNYWDDYICEVQLVKDPSFSFRDFEKFLIEDFIKAN